MEFIVYDIQHSIRDIERLCGYQALGLALRPHARGLDLVRKIGIGDYPRFLLVVEYLNGGDSGHRFSLQLEKAPDVKSHRRSGRAVAQEAERIREALRGN